ncbi:hypothetical protein H5P28_16985 [Ruficoccus amylovorans]|uniref:Core-binding (CB) domain-containing protein n=1 Tax=Ruficoccus amylovorans TaxID=1804625 RepID=A0A842HHF9_9BACT|nr:hypothetical protein [Ruficoccus amylovorans]MBC2595963.1 hypothetical protein [Ruficoccus amylovorans]
MSRPKRVERFQVKAYTNDSGTTSWKVSGYWPDGKRERKNFRYKADAVEHRARIETEAEGAAINYQLQRTALSREQLADAESAINLGSGTSVAEIVAHYRKLETIVHDKTGLSLDGAVHFLIQHYKPELEDIAIGAAIERFLKSKEGHRKRTHAYYTTGLKLLQRMDPNTLVHQIGLKVIEPLLSKYKNNNTQRTYRRSLSTFFNWCVRHHYAVENPCARLDQLPADNSQVSILSLDETKRLLRASMIYSDGAMAPAIALGLFAGLRPSEIDDLETKNIKDEYIVVTGGKLRRQMNRRVPKPEILSAWLKKFPFTGQPKGAAYKMKILKVATQAEHWVQDIIRHTSISFQLERDKDDAYTAFNNGTSRTMIERHYRDVIDDPKSVDAYWEISPESLKTIKVHLPMGQGLNNWPSDHDLKVLVWEKPLSRLADDFGVSDQAIRKRCLKRGIELPKNGHWQRERRK